MPCHSCHVQLAVDFVESVVVVEAADIAVIPSSIHSPPNRVYYAYDDSDEQSAESLTKNQPTMISFDDHTVDIHMKH